MVKIFSKLSHSLKGWLLIGSILFLIPSLSFGAIAFDAATNGGSQNATGGSVTFSHTTSGSNRILFVAAIGAGNESTAITAVTYNGVAMTFIDKTLVPANREIYMYYLVNPASGANNVVITGTMDLIGGYAASYTGAAQTQVLDTDVKHSTNTGSSVTSLSVNTTTTVDNSWAVSFIVTQDATNTAGANTTKRIDDTITYGLTFNDNNAAITPAGGITESMGASAAHNMAGIIASFAPVAPAVSSPQMQIIWTD